ncbi:class I SAM-dependent methyltransferase [uncultured Helicobacter sp.]|uniref:class I SAM-dependent methyltransferase n=1 Tax=uncultured Helicobacter sp. TaxID=175537 RepID=UPI00374FAB6B
MDLNYWKTYYQSHRHNAQNSLFSTFVRENYLKPHARLLELGCGNGRDSVYFAKSGIATTAIDQVDSEIDYLNANFGSESCAFVCGDFSDLNALKSLQAPYDCVYSRFSLHSITYTQQTRLFSQIPHYLAFGGILAIETRGHKNALYQKGERVSGEEGAYIYQSHYRRFVALEDLLADIRTMSRESNTESKTTQNQSPSTKLKPSTFEILYAQESRGFAPFTQGDITEDDYFIRVIARLKSPLGGGQIDIS